MSSPALTAASTTIQQLSSLPSPPPPTFRTNPTNSNSPDHHRHFPCKSPQDSTTASWTSSIAHHCRNGRLSKAVSQFSRMRESGIQPNHVTVVTLLSGCVHFPSQGFLLGPAVHGYARKLGLDVHNVMVGTAVIDMYSKFGELGLARLIFDHMEIRNKVTWNTLINGCIRNDEFGEALNMFDKMPERDAVSWTVLINGFVNKGEFHEALEWFQQMQLLQVVPDFVTIISVLTAVANLGMLSLGLWLHRFVMMNNFQDNVRVNNSLIDMYCRCGCIDLARQVFEKMPERSLVTWNSIIVGLACNAHAEAALSYFHAMIHDGFKPDGVTFTGALTACSHTGLVDEGLKVFETMTQVYKINPTIEHYGCIVDLYSRAGRLKEAVAVVDTMPMKPNEVVIGSLLAACRECEDGTGLAERLMERMYDLDPSGDFCYVLLSNIYAGKGRWRGASNVRKKMKDLGVQKRPGISSVEVDGRIHEFMSGDRSHVDAESIHIMVELLASEVSIFGDDSQHLLQTCGFDGN